jgi:hypothetical protein
VCRFRCFFCSFAYRYSYCVPVLPQVLLTVRLTDSTECSNSRILLRTPYLLSCASPTFWALFQNALQTEIPELCTRKLCRFYEASLHLPRVTNVKYVKMSVSCPRCRLQPLDSKDRLVVMVLYECCSGTRVDCCAIDYI